MQNANLKIDHDLYHDLFKKKNKIIKIFFSYVILHN